MQIDVIATYHDQTILFLNYYTGTYAQALHACLIKISYDSQDIQCLIMTVKKRKSMKLSLTLVCKKITVTQRPPRHDLTISTVISDSVIKGQIKSSQSSHYNYYSLS